MGGLTEFDRIGKDKPHHRFLTNKSQIDGNDWPIKINLHLSEAHIMQIQQSGLDIDSKVCDHCINMNDKEWD